MKNHITQQDLKRDSSLPLATHAHGVAAHLVFGLAVAAVTDTAWALTDRTP